MYFVYETEEIATGFLYANISNKVYKEKEGIKLISATEFCSTKAATSFLLPLRKELRKHNVQLDPNYTPISKRKRGPGAKELTAEA